MTYWSAPSHITALIFDCDGTLADTMPIHYVAWNAMLSRHGIPFSEKRFYELGGVPTYKIIQILSKDHGVQVPDIDAMVHEKEQIFLERLAEVQPVRPVFRVAVEYRGRMPMAVASGGYRKTVTETLEHLGVRDWFDTIVCAEDTKLHKPEPDVFLEAARRLNQPPAQCLVFEDTDIGLEAARRAGMEGIDIRTWIQASS